MLSPLPVVTVETVTSALSESYVVAVVTALVESRTVTATPPSDSSCETSLTSTWSIT